jgi:hypothetical protein
MAPQDPKDDDRVPNATSPGNEGARGSRGQANSGAQPVNSTNERGNQRAPAESEPDARGDGNAQGGGGIASESSRSR